MASRAITDPERRHDFVLLFDVTDGNPNGDPDAANLPRVDPETMQGLVTDVCLKRKVRDYVDATRGDQERFKIYVQSRTALNTLHARAYKALNLKSTGTKQKQADVDQVRHWMTENFYDIRMFGAVMTTDPNCGQVRGPIQLTFARSVEPIVPLDLCITRVAITRPEDMEVVVSEEGEGAERGKRTEMGRKAIVPYGLYIGKGFFNAHFADQAGVTSDDLGIFWEALQRMWDLDRSSARGMMTCRGVYVFTHEDKLGKAPAHGLMDRIRVKRRDAETVPRSFSDYAIEVDTDALPEGVTYTPMVA